LQPGRPACSSAALAGEHPLRERLRGQLMLSATRPDVDGLVQDTPVRGTGVFGRAAREGARSDAVLRGDAPSGRRHGSS
jgi:hypothetical protein